MSDNFISTGYKISITSPNAAFPPTNVHVHHSNMPSPIRKINPVPPASSQDWHDRSIKPLMSGGMQGRIRLRINIAMGTRPTETVTLVHKNRKYRFTLVACLASPIYSPM